MSETYSDAELTRILRSTKCIAVVGVSMNPVRPSYYVARYLGLKGYRVIPVNPGHAGERLFGETVRADLAYTRGAYEQAEGRGEAELRENVTINRVFLGVAYEF